MPEHSSVIWCDPQSFIGLAKNSVFHARSNHIKLNIHFVGEKIACKQIDVRYITYNQLANCLTKSIPTPRLCDL